MRKDGAEPHGLYNIDSFLEALHQLSIPPFLQSSYTPAWGRKARHCTLDGVGRARLVLDGWDHRVKNHTMYFCITKRAKQITNMLLYELLVSIEGT